MLIDRFNFGRRRREQEEQKTDLRQCKRWNARSWWEPRIPRMCRPSTVRQEKFRINKKKSDEMRVRFECHMSVDPESVRLTRAPPLRT